MRPLAKSGENQMSDEFKLSDLNNPLYEHSQVITQDELIGVYITIDFVLNSLKWWHLKKKYDLRLARQIVEEMIHWIQDGKKEPKETK